MSIDLLTLNSMIFFNNILSKNEK